MRSHRLPPIHPVHARRIAIRSATLWLLIRVGLFLVALSPPLSQALLEAALLNPLASVVLVGAAVVLLWLDGVRLNEHLFHANLGTPAVLGAGIGLATVAALELGTTALLVLLLP